MGMHWRSRSTSWTTFLWSSIRWIAIGKTNPRSFLWIWVGESTELGMSVCSSETWVILSVYVDDIKMAGKKQNMAPMWKKWWKLWILTNPHQVLAMCTWNVLSVNANRMNTYWTIYKDVRITFFCWSNRKTTGIGKTSRANGSVVPRHGGTCSTMHWAILRVVKQESEAIIQSFKPLFWWSSIQAGGTRTCWRIVRSLLANCLRKLVFGTNWTTWHLVGQQVCEVSHKMDSGMWQTIRKTDFLHSSTRLSCGKHDIVLQSGFVSRLRLCWRSWGLKVNFKRCLVYPWKQNICPSHLDVQQTNFCLAQAHRVWDHVSGCWNSFGWVICSRSLGHGDWSVTSN